MKSKRSVETVEATQGSIDIVDSMIVLSILYLSYSDGNLTVELDTIVCVSRVIKPRRSRGVHAKGIMGYHPMFSDSVLAVYIMNINHKTIACWH